jgi:glycosyltransferase involved in cell wall biosynthesis
MKNFSVLISVYIKEKPEFLKKSLQSIWDDQILKPNEIVLIKDGILTKELDDTINDFSKNKPVKVITLKQNIGLGLALQEGVKNCSYEYIARMDSDDIAYPERFKKQMSFLVNNPHIDILGSYIGEFIDSIDNINSVRKVPLEHSEIIKNLRGRCPLNHPTVIIRKSALMKAGNYKPFFLKEDIYLWLRLYSYDFQFANLPECLLYFRLSKDTFKRRGGYKYAQSEFKIFLYRYKIGLINVFQLIFYLTLTLPVRLVPSFLRVFIYKFLR